MSLTTAIALKSEDYRGVGCERYQVTQTPPDTRLPTVVSKIIGYFDGKRSLADICQKGQISVTRGRAIVEKLTTMGILETVQYTPNQTFVSEFSPEEEAFFASEVEPIDECDEPFESVGDKVSLFFSEIFFRLRGNPVF